jgi:GGDEF domain-containing protein
MGKLTGRLQIKGRADTAMVFFVDGVPVHCTMKGTEGDEALIQLIGWDEGQFCFFPEPKTETKTVKKRLEFLIMEGCTFLDQYKSLTGKGLNFDAIVVRAHERLTEKEFEALVAKGTGIDVETQKQFYVSIDNHSSLFELLRSQQLSKIEWVPVLFNLVNCGLIEFRSKQQHDTLSLKPERTSNVDWSQMRLAEKALVRPDTGLYTFPAFLYFLDKEFCRYDRFDRVFSVVLLKVGLVPSEDEGTDQLVSGRQHHPLPIRAVRAMGQTIARIKRQIDVLAHYEMLDYALLLPETNRTSAENFANRLSDVLKYTAFEDIEASYVDFAIGLACVPDDCQDLESLIALAHSRVDAYEKSST